MTNCTQKSQNYKQECISYMSEVDLPLDKDLIVDENIHRYSADENKHKLDEWYVAYEGVTGRGNEYLSVAFGSWSKGTTYHYNSFDNSASFGVSEIEKLRKEAQVRRLKVEQEVEARRDETAKKAEELWGGYSPTPPSDVHVRYLVQKKIKAIGGIKFGPNSQGYPSIIVPINNVQGELRSLQYISLDVDGRSYKSFLSGGEKKGNYHLIGNFSDDEDISFVGEGYGTCVSIFEAIRKPVVVAFDAGNIDPVLEKLKKKFPKKVFIIAADNDEVGIKKALAAGRRLRCPVVIPRFPDLEDKGTDFNDLAVVAGIEEVRVQLQKVLEGDDVLRELTNKYFIRDGEPCKSFKLSNLPQQLREYIYSIQRTTNAHPIMIAASVLSMISAYLGTKVFIPDDKYFQTLYPNFWMLCLAKSGSFKTTALNKGARIAYKNQSKVFKLIRDLREDLKGSDADVEQEILKLSKKNVVLPTKMTAEAFLEYISQGHEGVIISSEFGGWLQNLDKNYNNDFKAIMTELYDIPIFYRYKTRTQGDCVLEKPYITICAVSTLSWIRSNIKPTDVPSGFFARFILFTPPFDDEIPPALPRPRDDSHQEKEDEFKEFFRHVLECIGAQRSFTLSKDAKGIFEQRHALIYAALETCSNDIMEFLQPYAKRWSPSILKIAMIMQLFIDPEKKEITREAVKAASDFLIPAINSTIALFEGELGESAHQTKCRILLDWIKKRIERDKLPVKRNAVLASKQLKGGVKEYDMVLEHLIEQGKITFKEFSKKNDSEYSLVDEAESN